MFKLLPLRCTEGKPVSSTHLLLKEEKKRTFKEEKEKNLFPCLQSSPGAVNKLNKRTRFRSREKNRRSIRDVFGLMGLLLITLLVAVVEDLWSRVGIFISGTIGLQNLLYIDKTNGSDYSVACHADATPLSLSLSLSACSYYDCTSLLLLLLHLSCLCGSSCL